MNLINFNNLNKMEIINREDEFINNYLSDLNNNLNPNSFMKCPMSKL